MRWWAFVNTPCVWLMWPWSLWDVGLHGQHAGVHVLRVSLLTVHVPLWVQRKGMGPQYLSFQITFWLPWRCPDPALGWEQRSLLAWLWGRLVGCALCSPVGPAVRVRLFIQRLGTAHKLGLRVELILSLILHASSEYSCFSGLENPGFPSPYLDNSWTADRYWTLESNWSS